MFGDAPTHSGSMGQAATDIWTAQAHLQPGQFTSDRPLGLAGGAHA